MLVLLLQYNTCSSQLKAVLIRGICKVSTRNVQLADPLPCSPQLLGFPPLCELFIIALFLYILLSALYIALPIFNPQRPRARALLLPFSETPCSAPGRCCGQNANVITGSYFPFVCLLGSQLHTVLCRHLKTILFK